MAALSLLGLQGDFENAVWQEHILCQELDLFIVGELNRSGLLTESDVRLLEELRRVEGLAAAKIGLVRCLKLAMNRSGDAMAKFREVLQRKQNRLFRKLTASRRTGSDVVIVPTTADQKSPTRDLPMDKPRG
jgi:hypothetical protein